MQKIEKNEEVLVGTRHPYVPETTGDAAPEPGSNRSDNVPCDVPTRTVVKLCVPATINTATPLEAAITYARLGFRIIPLHEIDTVNGEHRCRCGKADCPAPGKHPWFFKRWYDLASSDPDRVRPWFVHRPRSGIGLLMGGALRVIAIDIDGPVGFESLTKLEVEFGALPVTLAQVTGRPDGGEHRLFIVDNLYVDLIRNRVRVAPGIDVRSERGYVCATATLHVSGNRYHFNNPNQAIADLPEPWVKLLATPRRASRVLGIAMRPGDDDLPPLADRVRWATERLSVLPPAIQRQNGSLACLRAAIALVRGYCLPPNDVFDLLWKFYNPKCVPSWSETELVHKIDSAESNVGVPWRYLVDYRVALEQSFAEPAGQVGLMGVTP